MLGNEVTCPAEFANSIIMPNIQDHKIAVSQISTDASRVDMTFENTHQTRTIEITMRGEIPLPIVQALVVVADVKKQIEETLWRHYGGSSQDIKPRT